MDRDVGLRIDGIVSGIRAQLDWLAHLSKDHLVEEEYKMIAIQIGIAMGAIYRISSTVYEYFPDTVPPELRPPES